MQRLINDTPPRQPFLGVIGGEPRRLAPPSDRNVSRETPRVATTLNNIKRTINNITVKRETRQKR